MAQLQNRFVIGSPFVDLVSNKSTALGSQPRIARVRPRRIMTLPCVHSCGACVTSTSLVTFHSHRIMEELADHPDRMICTVVSR